MSTATWENRRLCDDGGCTGLIGGDGVCTVCGRATKFWGDERRRGMQDDGGEEAAEGEAATEGGAHDAEGDDRALCVDGGCTGLLDRDGRCNVCGKVDPDAIVRVRSSATSGGDADGDDGESERDDAHGDAGDDDDDDSDDRQLCPDGGCTGLIGADGACRVCGRRAEV